MNFLELILKLHLQDNTIQNIHSPNLDVQFLKYPKKKGLILKNIGKLQALGSIILEEKRKDQHGSKLYFI